MATNYAQNIYNRIRTLIIAADSRLQIFSRDEFDFKMEYVAKTGKALLLKLESDILVDDGGPSNSGRQDRIYNFSGKLYLKETAETQKNIFQLWENIKNVVESNKSDSSGNWHYARVDAVMNERDEDNDLHSADLTFEFHRGY